MVPARGMAGAVVDLPTGRAGAGPGGNAGRGGLVSAGPDAGPASSAERVHVADAVLILLMRSSRSALRQGFVIGALSIGGFLQRRADRLQSVRDRQPVRGQRIRLAVSLWRSSRSPCWGQTLAGGSAPAAPGHRQPPLQRIDDAGGAVVSVVALLLVAWLIAVPLVDSPFPG
jgi:hypothetical protein